MLKKINLQNQRKQVLDFKIGNQLHKCKPPYWKCKLVCTKKETFAKLAGTSSRFRNADITTAKNVNYLSPIYQTYFYPKNSSIASFILSALAIWLTLFLKALAPSNPLE